MFICFLTSELLWKSTAQLREPQFGRRVFVRFGSALLENLLNCGWGIQFQVVNEALSSEAAISCQILRLKSIDWKVISVWVSEERVSQSCSMGNWTILFCSLWGLLILGYFEAVRILSPSKQIFPSLPDHVTLWKTITVMRLTVQV